MNRKVIPAVLVRNFVDLESLLEKVNQISNIVQIDICDGIYTPKKTWPFNEFSKNEFIKNINLDTDITFPFWQKLSFSIDLMCENPSELIDSFCAYGAFEIIFHFGSLRKEYENKKDKYNSFSEYAKNIIEKCQSLEIAFSIAFSLKDDLSEFILLLKDFEDNIKDIQFMGIENLGLQGQNFAKEILEKIEIIKSDFPNKTISVDGGMNIDTIPLCKGVGADKFVVGSALDLKGEDYIYLYKELSEIVRNKDL